MPRGGDHHQDPEGFRALYRRFDLEDLVRILGWMREIDQSAFTAKQARALSSAFGPHYRWGEQRVRRILRVGVEVEWLAPQGGRFQITSAAPATLPPFAAMMNENTQDRPGFNSTVALEYTRRQLKIAFDSSAQAERRS